MDPKLLMIAGFAVLICIVVIAMMMGGGGGGLNAAKIGRDFMVSHDRLTKYHAGNVIGAKLGRNAAKRIYEDLAGDLGDNTINVNHMPAPGITYPYVMAQYGNVPHQPYVQPPTPYAQPPVQYAPPVVPTQAAPPQTPTP